MKLKQKYNQETFLETQSRGSDGQGITSCKAISKGTFQGIDGGRKGLIKQETKLINWK